MEAASCQFLCTGSIAYTKILWATAPPHPSPHHTTLPHPITFKHEGGQQEEGNGVVQHVQ